MRLRALSVVAGLCGACFGSSVVTAQVQPATPIPPQMPPAAAQPTQEDHPTLVLPEPSPRWIYVLEPVFPYLVASKVWILDGDDLSIKGMVNGGYTPNAVMSHDKSRFWLAETYWSRGSRGVRTDVVTAFDSKTLDPVGEVVLPNGRFLVVPKKHNATLTSDGRFLLSFNMDPAFSLSVVDVNEMKYLGELDTQGCSLAFPTGDRSVASVCPDGRFVHLTFDETGRAITSELGQPFFDSENDPVFEHAAVHRPSKQAFFISYEGWVYPVRLDGMPKVAERWKLQGPGDEEWRPGGWQLAAFHAASNRLFVTMHKGGKWTHKQAGDEVWVFDTVAKKRLHRLPLEHHSPTIAVSQDERPLLFALTETAILTSYDATTFEKKAERTGLGITPWLLYTFGE
jgi:methylamine dehydrogenase heavy chain